MSDRSHISSVLLAPTDTYPAACTTNWELDDPHPKPDNRRGGRAAGNQRLGPRSAPAPAPPGDIEESNERATTTTTTTTTDERRRFNVYLGTQGLESNGFPGYLAYFSYFNDVYNSDVIYDLYKHYKKKLSKYIKWKMII